MLVFNVLPTETAIWGKARSRLIVSSQKEIHVFVCCVDGCTMHYNAFNVYRRELAPGTVSLTGGRAQGDDSKHWAYSSSIVYTLSESLSNFSVKIGSC